MMNDMITSAQIKLPRRIHGWVGTSVLHPVRTCTYVLAAQLVLMIFIAVLFSVGALFVVGAMVAMTPAAIFFSLWASSTAPASTTAYRHSDESEDDREELPELPSTSDLIETVADRVQSIVPYSRLLVFLFRGDDDEELIYDRNIPAPQSENTNALQSGLTVPVHVDGVSFGRMVVFSASESAYSSSDLESLEAIAGDLGPILTRLMDQKNADTTPENVSRLVLENETLKDLVEDLQITNSELDSTVEELEWKNAQVQTSRARLVEAHESAKRSVAEELHGAVQTKLYAAWIQLRNMERSLASEHPEESAAIATIAAELDRIREEDIRLLSHRLHPSVIRLGLSSALRSLRDNYENVLPITLDISDRFAELEPAGESRLPKNLRLGLYRIAELAIGNVLKHAHASNCVIEVDLLEPTVVSLKITDDGVGFGEDARVPTGIGLATMDDYADSLDGHLTVTSLPGKGASLEVIMPISDLDESDDLANGAQAIGMLVDMHWAEPQRKTAT